MKKQLTVDYRVLAVYVMAIVYAVINIIKCGMSPIESVDTPTYYTAYEHLLHGEIDIYRTPVYPLFVGVIRDIVGAAHCYVATVALQYIIFLWGTWYFYKVAWQLVPNKWLAAATMLIYAATPWLAGRSSYVLTESLSVTGITIFVYLLLKIWRDEGLRRRTIAALGLVLTVIATSILGAADDWGRLSLPSMGILLILAAQVVCCLRYALSQLTMTLRGDEPGEETM